MEIITRLAGGLGLIYILYNVFYIWIDKGWLINKKPFNCLFCLSAWVSIGLTIWYLDIFYLSLALIYYILNSKL